MLRDAAVDMMMKRLGNSNDLTLRDDIIIEMVQAQETVLEGDVLRPWFLVKEDQTLQTTIGLEEVPLPTDFLALWELDGLYRFDAAVEDPYIEMAREDWDEIKEFLNYSNKPTHWDIVADNLRMRPLADAVYPLRFWYIMKDATLAGDYGTNNIENLWLQHASDWLIGEAGFIIADQYLMMPKEKVAAFAAQAARGRRRLYSQNVAMEETLKSRIRGG